MKRKEFLAMLGLSQLPRILPPPAKIESDKDTPICIGVVDGIPIEIECPDEHCKNQICPLGHCQIPLYIVHTEDETLKFVVCSICKIVFALTLPERREEK